MTEDQVSTAIMLLTVLVTASAVGYYWRVIRPQEHLRRTPRTLIRDDGGRAATAADHQGGRGAQLSLQAMQTECGWLLRITNTSPASAENVDVRSVEPIGPGVMPWVVGGSRVTTLRPGEHEQLQILLSEGNASGVVCEVTFRDRVGAHAQRHRILLHEA